MTEKRMTVITGDILDTGILCAALENVKCVIHTAGFVDVSLWPNHDKLNKINADGNFI